MATPAKITIPDLPTIVLMGRANVGKSTLFNKLIEKDKALVSNIPGTTRTNNEGLILWRASYVRAIDTGGMDVDESEFFNKDILKQATTAIDNADLIIFVTDAKTGVLPQEKKLARELNKLNKRKIPIILVANKVDNTKINMQINEPEWPKLGFGSPFPISAANGRNIGDFLDLVHEKLKKIKKKPKSKKELDIIDIGIVGKPNVGKSSIFNKLIGEDKVIVSPIAHTTREPFDTLVSYESKEKTYNLNFVDTAGIRRKAKVSGVLEKAGIQKSIETIQKSDIILLVLDGSELISSQDMQLGGMIEKKSKSVIIIVNKWDLAEDNSDATRNEVKKMIYAHFPHLDFAPILFISGKTGYRIHQIFDSLVQIVNARSTEIPSNVLDNFIEKTTRKHKPSRGKGTRQPKILGLKQINVGPPIFELFIKQKTSLHRSYLNFIENQLREQFNFLGTPIVIKITKAGR